MLQVSLEQVKASVVDEFKFAEFESYDSELNVQMELDLLDVMLEDLF